MAQNYIAEIAEKLEATDGYSDIEKIANKLGASGGYSLIEAIAKVVKPGGGGDDELLKGIIEKTVTDLTLPDNITTVGDFTFHDCTSLTNVNLPNVTNIGNNPFSGCTSLTSVNLSNVTNIGNYAFSGCTSLTSVNLPNVINISNYAFSGCTALTNVYIGASCTTISENAFSGTIQPTRTINCGFAEGAVTGAPWGATDATINYNVPVPSES